MIELNDIVFSVNRYDEDGYVWEEGIYIHIGEMSVRVAMDIKEYDLFIKKLEGMREEIKENL